jgi:hypothetical protein
VPDPKTPVDLITESLRVAIGQLQVKEMWEDTMGTEAPQALMDHAEREIRAELREEK